MWSLTTAVLYCTSFVDIFHRTSVAEQVTQLRPLRCDMASGSAGQTVDSTCSTAEIIIIDDEEIEQPRSRAEIYGDGAEPLPEADPLPNDGPLWQWCDGDTVYWHWLDASLQPNYTKLAWQAERVQSQILLGFYSVYLLMRLCLSAATMFPNKDILQTGNGPSQPSLPSQPFQTFGISPRTPEQWAFRL